MEILSSELLSNYWYKYKILEQTGDWLLYKHYYKHIFFVTLVIILLIISSLSDSSKKIVIL